MDEKVSLEELFLTPIEEDDFLSELPYMTYRDILSIPFSMMRSFAKQWYQEQVDHIVSDRYANMMLDRLDDSFFMDESISSLCLSVTTYEKMHTSRFLLPVDGFFVLCKKPLVQVSKRDRICYFCGEKISKGDRYVFYQPHFLDLFSNHLYYLKKPLILRNDCNHYLPSNIFEFELFQDNLNHVLNDDLPDASYLFPNPESKNPVSFLEFPNRYSDTLEFLPYQDSSQNVRRRWLKYERKKIENMRKILGQEGDTCDLSDCEVSHEYYKLKKLMLK